ncbi:SGNH/GDSL hydrolase family protein [Aeromicrobium sp. CTD01-1L150]|uniref:SGNH/GDSL hydrolase family protein n=1 Tax=Aeromicrobium sp. CTD01-1L150 TaxID=3341830 RepID=UPI0035C0CB3E
MRSIRKAAIQAAVGGGAVLTGYQGMLIAQALIAKRAIGVTDARPPRPEGIYGDDLPGAPLRVLVLGDSAAVGYGMHTADATPPAMIGISLAHVLDRPVDVRSEAVVGAQTSDLREQIDVGLEHEPDLVVIIVGTNDVTHRVPAYASTRLLAAAVSRLVEADAQVVVGTCPDLGTVEPIPQPLRHVARRKSRSLARKQTVAVVRAGGRAVSLGDLLGPVFAERSDVMFGDDRFHPSETGYANMVSALVPSLAAAWRERDRELAAPEVGGRVSSVSLTEAAERAGRRPGTEVSRQGRWARVLRRARG